MIIIKQNKIFLVSEHATFKDRHLSESRLWRNLIMQFVTMCYFLATFQKAKVQLIFFKNDSHKTFPHHDAYRLIIHLNCGILFLSWMTLTSISFCTLQSVETSYTLILIYHIVQYPPSITIQLKQERTIRTDAPAFINTSFPFMRN